MYAGPVERLIEELTRLPGIGRRTAQRLAFHIIDEPPDRVLPLADAIRDTKTSVRACAECFNLTDRERCSICEDPRRDPSAICVVEQPSDIVPIERTREFNGRYHVLGGALAPIDGVGPGDLRIADLVRRVAGGDIGEVVVATNPNVHGEATAVYIADALRDQEPRVRVTRIASGLPVGGDLEYADELTLGKALTGRRDM
jgi:recombination protein RecR